MEWQKQVLDCIRDVRFDKGKKPRFNESQSDNLCRAFLSKLSKFCTAAPRCCESPSIKRVSQCRKESGLVTDGDENSKVVLGRAWKEVYRVIKEAEVYLQACSGPDWWKRALTLAATGEAHAVHMHDLLYCVLGLELAIVLAGNHEAYDGVCCRRMGEFTGEMNSPLRIHEEYVDRKQLVSLLRGIWVEYEKKTALRRNITFTLNQDQENKSRLAKFLAEKLAELGFPKLLEIDPRDLKRKNNVGLSGQICEGSWLGIKVGLKEIIGHEFVQKEAMELARLQSPFLVQVIGVSMHGADRYYLVTEMVSSNLVRLLQESRSRLSLPLHVGIDIMLQISRGMEYLHGQRKMHLDLRPVNVLIEPSAVKDFRDEGHCRVKILNMGKAGLTLSNEGLLAESWPWMAPEVYGGILKSVTYKADVYSFGMICYHILTGKQPFEEFCVGNNEMSEIIKQGRRPIWPSSCPSMLADYISKCWDTDPASRPHFCEVSQFLRYMKLLVMRIPDTQKCDSFWSVCTELDRKQIEKCFEGNIALSADERVTSEEEGLIIRALDGDFPESFSSLDEHETGSIDITAFSPARRSFGDRLLFRPGGMDIKSLVSLPAYIKKYSYEELHKATSGFSMRIDSFSGSCPMWKAILPDRAHLAVKLLEKTNSEKFCNEVTVLSYLHHPNIIHLRGVCIGLSKYLLVYDYMAMDSLDKRLFSAAGEPGHQSHVLTWIMRRRIGLGLARGLAYLHRDCRNRVLNVKIDANSILLDERFTAKLSGFGSARPADFARPESRSNGSNNWVKRTGQEDEEAANVYSFGVVLLEILTGFRCIDTPYSDYYCLHETVHGLGTKNVMEFVDTRLRDEISEKEARNVINLGLWCLIKDPSLRPSMTQAVLVMEGLLELGAPPLGRLEILPPPLRSHHFLQYQRTHQNNNNNSNTKA